MVALGLSGCGGEDEPAAARGTATAEAVPEITFQVTGDPEETRVYKDLAESYKRDTGRTVKIDEVPERDVHLAKLTTGFSAGQAPEVFLLNYRYLGGFADKGVVEPAGPRLDKSNAFAREDFYPIPMAAFEYQGELQCVPQNASSLAVYYNKDLFERAGVAEPGDSWTYEQFTTAADKLTTGETYGVGIDLSTIRAAPWVWAAGGELVDDPVNPTKFLFDTPEGRRGLEHVVALRANGWSPTADEADSKAIDERFLEGSLGMFLSSRRDVPMLRTITGFEWDVAPFPTDVEPASVLHSDGFCIAKGEHADAAWLWVEYALGKAGQQVLAASGRSVPSLKAVAESPAFLDPSEPPANSKVFVDALSQMHQLPVTANWSEVEGRTDDILGELYYGRIELDEALDRLAKETDGQF
ncbi:sugar ABC transporter substrate-binding protein [Solirubrobacter phytolaccae]|uniref:Sugar ABC transporter substrate-binding protein n=1 Tax=Solirubrobacter phytolaccae TaxID=1404360 RepID=A0A9X3SB93_9ACTN|nr:sugar ABC transporter substrate-binding protein [Solirubrobacter phytolaccae]MDA0183381.1 sugar ABC transporter substrate-binding protein [Solirubrobacter phytolaccae]